MIVKLSANQYEFLKNTLGKERSDLFKHLSNGNGVAIGINDEVVIEIRDWVGEKLQKEGFDENYELNENGKILEQLEDLLYS
ncbi:hypothetical protein [Sediminibacterium sp. C3]|uniref:hypothetical protein n=1 Tax=Sediminibacterium sp. C3 TaxID=1267211 RepID=UPI00040C2305|nr:hypothetical protein [Sediminibacterium sp. C3]